MNTRLLTLIPYPQHIKYTDDTRVLTECGVIKAHDFHHVTDDDRHLMLETLMLQLQETLSDSAGLSWSCTPIPLQQPLRQSYDLTEGINHIVLRMDTTITDQGYALHIPPHGEITITASSLSGLRNGIQTLRQLIMMHRNELPCLSINDSPALKTRGLTYDVSRGRVPTLAYLKGLVDTLCLYKYNHLELYIEHTFAFPETHEAWEGKDPLSAEDISELDTYCLARGIELVPALASFGHMYEVLRTSQWNKLGEHPELVTRKFSFIERMIHHTINPTHEESLRFISMLIDEYSSLFRSRQFNIGGDETFDLGTGASAERAKEIGIPRLYAEYVSQLCTHMMENGLSPIVYADIPLKHPELLELLPKGVTLANWDYRIDPSEENVSTVRNSGYTQLVCPGAHTWNRMLPALHDSWSNISTMCSYGRMYEAQGMLMTDWGDYGHINDPVFSLPSFAYAAECSWSGRPVDKATVDSAISALTYHDVSQQSVFLLSSTQGLQSFSWADAVQYLEIEDTNATVNRDVAWVLGYDDAISSVSEARYRFISERLDSIQKYAENNVQLHDIAERFLQTDTGSASSTAVLMIHGQILLNELGFIIASHENLISPSQLERNKSDSSFADAIRSWFHSYSQRWHETSRHSQIDDLAYILHTYCQKLEEGYFA
ncbi:hypothetical protein B9G54_00505 [Alloscardovia macacae]|uniref:beta-N-acetylhexosaminidase n=1 Tax=Alloscardovia macacae TaxID=1160091 RepID=A0A1Y2T2F1_9BIFI|nr:family 20 glycosylhydrolase [Alloscardovia macacae]OTA27590.1 hypothetical protein B9G54_00505 [Alloscardovia macacae]OTA30236.1 hypothetical protein B9T39_00585 [Alloscardovia macacae]